ncbi:hypothetical protein [Coxiella endosymbiont of Ornithodoros maritimus]|uniref:hypothetical protein n=1 Tax=Coxiella endosymbiont of Ornithodoros maritimus TaxID=1656172 RepID=UPI002B40035A|nr:hypothetical protein [Coxiella endosymbiont of Ornithodoros maritimus]
MYIERLRAPSHLGLVNHYDHNISPLLRQLEEAYRIASNEETKGEESITFHINFWTSSQWGANGGFPDCDGS